MRHCLHDYLDVVGTISIYVINMPSGIVRGLPQAKTNSFTEQALCLIDLFFYSAAFLIINISFNTLLPNMLFCDTT